MSGVVCFLRLGRYLLLAWCLAGLGSLHASPVYTDQATEACVTQAASASPSLSGHAVLACAGLSAQRCMAAPGGDTTVGMMDCLQAELGYWDRRLNAAYARRMGAARAEDAAMTRIRATTASLADSLKAMQRSWMRYRDAACLYEQAQWLGGTGGGPASLACHLHETARQTLKLEGWWAQ